MSLSNKWTKSTRSNPGGNCVEVRCTSDGTIQVRDSKDPHGPVLAFIQAEWDDFVVGIKAQKFIP